MDLKVEIVDHGTPGICVVRINGDFNCNNCGDVKTIITGELNRENPLLTALVFDLLLMNNIDSSGLGTLVSTLKTCNEKGIPVILIFDNPQIKKIFNITGLIRVFKIVKTVEEALKKLLFDATLATPI